MSVLKSFRAKNLLAALSMVTLMGAVGIVSAPVAFAAASPAALSSSDSMCYIWNGDVGTSNATVTGAVGDTFTVQFPVMGGQCAPKTIVGSAGVATPSTGTITTTAAKTFTIVGAGSFKFTGAPFAMTITIVVTAGVPPVTTVVTLPAPPVPDKMQAVPRPSTGCATFVSDASINWFGIAGTGWNSSWAQWMNNGLGGDVCVRMLGYNMTTSSWFIR